MGARLAFETSINIFAAVYLIGEHLLNVYVL